MHETRPLEGCRWRAGAKLFATNEARAVFTGMRASKMSDMAAEALRNPVATPAHQQTATDATALGFDEAFMLHHRAVYNTSYALLRDAGLAEDVTQEVFLRLYHQLDAEPPANEFLRPWLLRVAINLSHNTLRSRTRSVAREEEFAKQTIGTDGLTAPLDADYERHTEIEEARRALEKIEEPMRSCLLLKQQGLSYREIASTLSINETYVGSLVARGRKEFARVYGKIGGRR
jgi:RNA polymerase sigma-70 factor (ECF subfamily)